MNTEVLVAVYSLGVFDLRYESAPVSRFKATRGAIRGKHGGDPIEGTAEQVHPADLDEASRYTSVATGWGVPSQPSAAIHRGPSWPQSMPGLGARFGTADADLPSALKQ